jgi:hypothetical protein
MVSETEALLKAQGDALMKQLRLLALLAERAARTGTSPLESGYDVPGALFLPPMLGAPLGPAFPSARGFFCAWEGVPRQLDGGRYQRNSMASHHTGSDTDMLGFMSIS